MLATIKKLMKSWFAAVLLGLVIISTAFLGLGPQGDVLGSLAGNFGTWVIKAGPNEVSAAEFKTIFDRMKKGAEQQYQTQISYEMAVKNGLEKQALDELMETEAIGAMIKKLGLRAPDSLVDEAMKQQILQLNQQYPGLIDEITGEVNLGGFSQLLGDNGLTLDVYRKGLRDQIAAAQLGNTMQAGLVVPRIYSALQGAYSLEQRDVDYFVITPQSVGAIPPPTDAEMEAFLKQNAAQLMRPEMRVLQVVRFSAEDFKGKVTADPAEVQKRFEFRKDSLSAPELRSFVQIPIKNAGQATAVADRLRKGEDPAAIAKSVGATVVNNSDKPRSAIFDKAVGDAAFSLPVGGVSGALKGELGQSVIKVTGITPARTANLEEHRAELEADVIKAAAANKAYEQAQAYDQAHAAGANMAQAAAKAGATIVSIGPVTAQGTDVLNRPVPGVSKQLLDTAFGLPAGSDSPLVEISAGDQFAVRVEKIVPPAPPPLAEVRDQLSKALMARKQSELMQARAKALSDRARKGESLAAIAASSGYKLVQLPKMTRQGAREHQALGNEMLQTIFTGATGQVFTVGVQGQGLAVGKIGAVRPGEIGQIAQATEMGRRNFSNGVFQDIDGATRAFAKETIKPKANRDRAIKALGLDPKEYAEKKPEEAGKAKGKDEKSK